MAPPLKEDLEMFDKLIVSEPEGADFKNRRGYFMVSSLVVGILFATAVVISIFAADIGIGNSRFELVEMLAPVEMAPVEPEIPQRNSPPATTLQSQSQLPARQINMAGIDENPIVPTAVSVVPNTQMSRPIGNYRIEKFDSDSANPGGSGRNSNGTGATESGLSTTTQALENIKDTAVAPPVVKDPPPSRKSSTPSLGVINGKAYYLPKPAYSAAAIAVRAEGKVDVQVMIDETGKVVSANAVSGHPMLRGPAERAARNAKFTPTYLSKVPVKVTGVIVYNFTR